MLRRVVLVLALVMSIALVGAKTAPASASAQSAVPHFAPVTENDIHGIAVLRQLRDSGTSIKVVALGLEPGHTYVSLYYDNDECALEPYEEEDVIGDGYTSSRGGVGRTRGVADDDLDEIHSVSVRDADTFDLLACAVVSPDDED